MSEAEIIVPGFSWDEGDLLMRFVAKPDKNHPGEVLETWEPCLPFNVVPLRALREGEDLTAVAVRITFPSGRTKSATVSSEIVSANRPAPLLREVGLDVTHKEAVALAEFIEVIVNEAKGCVVPERVVIKTATWQDNKLLLPEDSLYGVTAGDEDSAQAAWREIIFQAGEHPRLAMALGAAAISPFMVRFNTDIAGFTLHVHGRGNSGKTHTLKTQVAIYGRPHEDALLTDWKGTKNHLLGQARDAGLLPVVFDDTSKIQARSAQDAQSLINDIVYAVAGGRDKGRMNADGSLRRSAPFHTVALSTGESPIVEQGLVGPQSRVVEVSSPTVEDAELQARLKDLATKHHGWPIRWICDTTWDVGPDLPAEFRYADESDPLHRAAMNVGLCALGFHYLARAIGVEHAHAAELGRDVFDQLRERYEDLGLSVGDQLWDAVRNYILEHKAQVIAYDPIDVFSNGYIGRAFRDDGSGDVALKTDVVKRIALDIGLGSPETALRELADNDRVRRIKNGEGKTKLVSNTTLLGDNTKVYRFLGMLHDDSLNGWQVVSEDGQVVSSDETDRPGLVVPDVMGRLQSSQTTVAEYETAR